MYLVLTKSDPHLEAVLAVFCRPGFLDFPAFRISVVEGLAGGGVGDGVSHRNCGSPLHADATIQIWIRHVTSYKKGAKS